MSIDQVCVNRIIFTCVFFIFPIPPYTKFNDPLLFEHQCKIIVTYFPHMIIVTAFINSLE